jgi:hypothetical protein
VVWKSIIEYEVFEFNPFSQQVSTSPNLDPLVSISMQLGHTFSHWVWQKEKERKSFHEGGNWGHGFLQKVGPITQETVYPPFNMHTYHLNFVIYLHQQAIYMKCVWYFQDYWCICLSHLILSLIISYPYLTRCVMHNGPTINLTLTINIVW